MKRLLLMILAIALCVCICSCSSKWTKEDISKAHTVEITKYHDEDPNVQDIYTISDAETVRNLCNTFSVLALKDTHIKETVEKSFYIRFIGNGGEIDHVTVIAGHNTLQDQHGDLYKITDEMDLEHYLHEIIEGAPSKIVREPEEDYSLHILYAPAENSTFGETVEPPVWAWSYQKEVPKELAIEIDCMNGEPYMEIKVNGSIASYMLSADEWETIKDRTPSVDGAKKVRWRIRIDPVYHSELEPYCTDWSCFYITENP